MDPLTISASNVSLLQLTRSVAQYICEVKNADETILKLLNEFGSIRGLLLTLNDGIEGDQYSSGPRLVDLQALEKPGGAIEQTRSALQNLEWKSTPIFKSRIAKRLVWPFHKEETWQLVNAIERQKGVGVRGIADEVDLDRDNALEWLSSIDISAYHEDIAEKYEPGTGFWLLYGEKIIDWERNGGFIGLRGKSGCGKTVLGSNIITDISDEYKNDPPRALGFFYFDSNNAQMQQLRSFLRSILVQLSRKQENLPSAAEELYSRYRMTQRQPKESELKTVLLTVMSQYQDVYIILDAIDESSESRPLLGMMRDLMIARVVKVHLLVTYRSEVEEMLNITGLPGLVQVEFPTKGDEVKDDIRLYVQERLSSDPQLA
ncbi:hypothetical protein B0J14DRAFT_569858 [Halenospora varia]|nr:hypothetical protein B0J14DRAFT_569858 [Halenospora varia]